MPKQIFEDERKKMVASAQVNRRQIAARHVTLTCSGIQTSTYARLQQCPDVQIQNLARGLPYKIAEPLSSAVQDFVSSPHS